MDLLQEIQAVHKIRDPIYGYIWLTEDERQIIDDPLFQRLRRIHQLALTKYVYPAAEHSRFAHSLGVLQSATNIFLEFFRSNPEADLWLGDNKDPLKSFKILRFASLLHDIGHMPFSHGLEKAFLGEGLKHEHISKYIIENYEPFTKIFKNNNISKPAEISNLIAGQLRPASRFLKRIISHEFDADRADYLLRDSYICGVEYGKYDYIRYSGSFKLIKTDEKPELAIEFGSIHLVESFLLARYYYLMQVAFHRTRVGFDLAMEQYVDYLKEKNKLPKSGISVGNDRVTEIDFNLFPLFDDYKLFEIIKSDYLSDNKWAKILMRQDHLRPIFDKEYDTPEFKNQYLVLIRLLEEEGLIENNDYFLFEKNVPIHKLVLSSDEADTERTPVVDKKRNNREIGDLLELSPIISELSRNKSYIRRIYVTDEVMDKAIIAMEKFDQHFEELKRIEERSSKAGGPK